MSIQKIRNNALGTFKNKKGFTLVEVIVVLVILAILAAILVPRLTGWIDQAKDKTATGEGHLVLSALQAYASDAYGKGTLGSSGISGTLSGNQLTEVNNYLEGDIEITENTSSKSSNLTDIAIGADGAVTAFTYQASNGNTIYYYDGGFNSTAKPSGGA